MQLMEREVRLGLGQISLLQIDLLFKKLVAQDLKAVPCICF